MIYEAPTLTAADEAVLGLIDGLREQLRWYLVDPRRWFGTLRRATLARAVQGSNSIEGYRASVEDVAAVLEGEEPLDADGETREAIAGYRDAMTYVLRLAGDPPPLDVSLIRSLHFMMMKYDLTKNPGQWRPGAVWVQDARGDPVYEAPDRSLLEDLMAEAIDQANSDVGPPLVRAAMAHLNVAMVHPFSDGNGRMARCLQTFVLASGGLTAPEFSSIEEYLGRNTEAYYAVLTEVGQGQWSPSRSTKPWIRFCLTAHFRQAHTVLRRVQETEALWDRCEQLVDERRLPRRAVPALCDAARGYRLRRSMYVKLVNSSLGEEITDATATRELRALAEGGLFEAVGEKRGRSYLPTPELRDVWTGIRARRGPRGEDDPYEHGGHPTLPGIS